MAWQIEGEYIETCNCSFLRPCITSNLAARPTQGECKTAIAMQIDRGSKDGVDLSGLCFVVLLHSPGVMADGNLKVGLLVDETADETQAGVIQEIASGAAGGPMAALAPLVREFAGVQKRPIRFEIDDTIRSVSAGDLLDQAVEGVPSPAFASDGGRRGATREMDMAHVAVRVHPISRSSVLRDGLAP